MDGNAKLWAGFVSKEARAAAENLGAKKLLKEIGQGPILFEALFRIPTEDSTLWDSWHFQNTPDFDNLAKLALDNILTDKRGKKVGLLETDDCRVARNITEKIWVESKKAGATFRLSRLPARCVVGIDSPSWLT